MEKLQSCDPKQQPASKEGTLHIIHHQDEVTEFCYITNLPWKTSLNHNMLVLLTRNFKQVSFQMNYFTKSNSI